MLNSPVFISDLAKFAARGLCFTAAAAERLGHASPDMPAIAVLPSDSR